MRSIEEIEAELRMVTKIDDHNWEAVKSSDRPDIDKVFAISSSKRRAILEQELSEAISARSSDTFDTW